MKYILIVFTFLATLNTTFAQTQENPNQIDFQEMMKQMEEMMKDFPLDSISFEGIEQFQFGDVDMQRLGESMEGLMQKMQEAFQDIDLSGVEDEMKKMEEEFRKQLPEHQSEKDRNPSKGQEKKRKTTKL